MGELAAWLLIEKSTTESTNDDARQLIQQGAANVVIIAEEQTRGRGRQQRVWQSKHGNLYCTFVVAPQQDIRDFPLYTFVAALAVRRTVQHFLPAQNVQVKWPNDALVNGKKISGILLEVENKSLIIGIGINCAHYPEKALFPATSLKDNGSDAAPKETLEILAENLSELIADFNQNGFASLREEWLNHAYKLNEEITIQQDDGIVTGVLTDLAADGALILQTADGSLRVMTGDLHAARD